MAGKNDSFDPTANALYLEDGGRAQTLPLDENFWRDLTQGAIAVDNGWLTMVLTLSLYNLKPRCNPSLPTRAADQTHLDAA